MERFLQKLAKELYENYGIGITNTCIVFPSRRAGIFFKKYISELIKKPIWLPPVFSIQDFIQKYSPLPVIDKITLIFSLYEVYQQFGTEETFDVFYPWGEMMLSDFDEMDKNLVEADKLFRILREIKEVEKEFAIDVTDIEEFYKFWQTFSSKTLSDVQDNFILTWDIMGKVYHAFRKKLAESGNYYEGMAYRRVYELIRTNELKLEHKKVIFAGFSYLYKAEEGIFRELIKQDIAEVYWDADEYYVNDKLQEAGHFLRKNFVTFNQEKINWIENLLSQTGKNFKIIGAPLKVSQAKVLGNELKNISAEKIDNTAVVLPDESLLLPVLNSIPDNVTSLNVTMGFPFRHSTLYSLLLSLKNLQKGLKGKGKSAVFYHKHVTQILLHPYIKFISPYEIFGLVNTIKKRNIIYLSRKRILESFTETPELISAVFNESETTNDSLDYIYNIITLISKRLELNKEKSIFEMEYLFKFYTELNHLRGIIEDSSIELDSDTFWKLIIEISSTIRIPFTGEPLKGLQLMGLLETRTLDFENVFILSMNEEILPKGNNQSSFIPYSLRKAFGLPTYDDDDSTAAYNFYRLLQRAKNICLIYNTEPGELNTGEKSRFLMQIENELALSNKNLKLENYILKTNVEIPRREEIIVEKSDKIIESLKSERFFSATALSVYINCPLQFYFRTVAKLKQEEEVEESFTGWGFGTVFHQIMDDIYREFSGKVVDKRMLFDLRDKVKKDFDSVWMEACGKLPEYEEFKSGLAGKNLLFKSIIKKLVNKVLTIDMQEAPFKVITVENESLKEIDIAGTKVKLFGRLDRVEEKDGVTRIVDYKTGVVNKSKLKKNITPENIDELFTNPALREKFQQYFYSTLYLNGDYDKKLKIGIYPLKNLSDGIIFFEEEYIPAEMHDLFEKKLHKLITEIFDINIPFSQTPEPERCRFCAYNSICFRD